MSVGTFPSIRVIVFFIVITCRFLSIVNDDNSIHINAYKKYVGIFLSEPTSSFLNLAAIRHKAKSVASACSCGIRTDYCCNPSLLVRSTPRPAGCLIINISTSHGPFHTMHAKTMAFCALISTKLSCRCRLTAAPRRELPTRFVYVASPRSRLFSVMALLSLDSAAKRCS